MCPKSGLRDPIAKIPVCPFQIAKMQSTKCSWLNLLHFGTMSSTISLRLVKKIIIRVSLVPMACRVPGMTSVGDRVSNFEDGSIESLNM
jgi:hypothetical protein